MSEFVDLYDRNRKFLNRVVDRNTYLFQPGEFMMYVLAILENEEGKFLVTQRALDKKWAAGGWEMPVVYSYFNEDQKRHDNYFVDIYHFKFDFQLSDVTLNTRESIDCRCVSLDELVAMNNEDEFLHFERIMKALQQKK